MLQTARAGRIEGEQFLAARIAFDTGMIHPHTNNTVRVVCETIVYRGSSAKKENRITQVTLCILYKKYTVYTVQYRSLNIYMLVLLVRSFVRSLFRAFVRNIVDNSDR